MLPENHSGFPIKLKARNSKQPDSSVDTESPLEIYDVEAGLSSNRETQNYGREVRR